MWQFRYTGAIYKSRAALFILRVVDLTAVIFCGLALGYAALAMTLGGDYLDAVFMLIYLAVTFLTVTLARRIINAARPYEIYDFGVKIVHKRGSSFPSRHVASAAAIATALMPGFLPLGIAVAVLTVALAAVRVMLGLHFVRDVFSGALIGVIGSLIGIAVF